LEFYELVFERFEDFKVAPRDDVILRVEDLKTYFFLKRGVLKAVDGVSFDLRQGEVLGLVGESGCGKSVACRSILRLVPSPGKIVAGKIIFENENLLEKNSRGMRQLRGRKISMILQDPSSSLNPVLSIGNQVAEAIKIKQRLNKADLWKAVKEMLELLRFPAPEKRLRDYPHQLSGGMNQRVVGAIALSANPKLLLADEPTTALDVTTQAQFILELRRLQKQFRLSMIFVTHDLGVVATICDRVCVMYAGKIVEQAPIDELFNKSLHPYTGGLLRSLPPLGKKVDMLPTIPGEPPLLLNLPPGCGYFPRCPLSKPRCENELPPEVAVSDDHLVRCWEVS
jgi:peptide/nickel transport system ATP-binding protein/oligopeptide transport system ATP-binding protein